MGIVHYKMSNGVWMRTVHNDDKLPLYFSSIREAQHWNGRTEIDVIVSMKRFHINRLFSFSQ